jgi:serine/threonine protein kinase
VTGLAAALTSEGTILGTPQYMAPEQYEGKEADERSDIFAFGCVVYEMVTGKRCFDGKTKASLIASVLGGEPAPMSTLVPVTPPAALERLVKRCIEKDPEDRYQSMRDVVLDLRSIGAGGTEVKAQAKGLLHTQVWIVAGGFGGDRGRLCHSRLAARHAGRRGARGAIDHGDRACGSTGKSRVQR